MRLAYGNTENVGYTVENGSITVNITDCSIPVHEAQKRKADDLAKDQDVKVLVREGDTYLTIKFEKPEDTFQKSIDRFFDGLTGGDFRIRRQGEKVIVEVPKCTEEQNTEVHKAFTGTNTEIYAYDDEVLCARVFELTQNASE